MDDDDFMAGASLLPRPQLAEVEVFQERRLDKRPRRTARITEREPFTVVKFNLNESQRDKYLKHTSQAEFCTSGNAWLPLGWRQRGKQGTLLRAWRCPFHKESGCKARLHEVQQPDGLITIERSGFLHSDHTVSNRHA